MIKARYPSASTDEKADMGGTEGMADHGRRRFLMGTAYGAAAIAGGAAMGAWAAPEPAGESADVRTDSGGGKASGRLSPVVRDFSDPVLELARLLHEAAEIEQDLMVQYLYAAFSLKPAYEDLIGYGSPNAKDFLGVAIQEMQHLGAVNRLTVEMGLSPVLRRQDFPYEVDIYPFPFELVACGRKSLARYVYCEAPAGAFDPGATDAAFAADVRRALGGGPRPNFVGSLYEAIIGLTREAESNADAPRIEWGKWREKLGGIKEEGEDGHFRFFKSVFLGTHPALQAHGRNVWSLPKSHSLYPAYDLAENPTAYAGHPNAVRDKNGLRLAWLGNLSYWAALGVLDMYYRGQIGDGSVVAQEIMTGPILSLARHMPAAYGCGLPFDPLSMSCGTGADKEHNRMMLLRLAGEASKAESACLDCLPEDYPVGFFGNLRKIVESHAA